MRLHERWTARIRRRVGLEDLSPHLLRDIGLDHRPDRAGIARVLREGGTRRT